MTKWEAFQQALRGKTVAILGAGISNRPLIPLFADWGAKVTVYDKNTALPTDVIADGRDISFCLGEDYLEHVPEEILFRSPGMRFDLPVLERARREGRVVTSEIEALFAVCPAPIFAVTGSDGKTTTTTLIYELLKEAGYRCHLGGNIGTPLLAQAWTFSPEDKVILELSSFQLHTLRQSPNVAVVTNLSPNHLDIHKSYEEYIEAKTHIFLHQTKEDTVILNGDNLPTRQLAEQAVGNVRFFSMKEEQDVWCDGEQIYLDGKSVLQVSDIRIPGWHNVENFMAAIGATRGLVSPSVIQKVAKTFGGVPHRIELVREYQGVKYYNSSIDSSPNRSRATLGVFPQKVILIAGGKDKGIPYDELGPVIAERVKHLLLIGKTADPIQKAVEATGVAVPITRCETYPQVVETAAQLAQPGDIVVLSPASTSFDLFHNFEERGDLFKSLVQQLGE